MSKKKIIIRFEKSYWLSLLVPKHTVGLPTGSSCTA